jgi:hypothetical protein
MEKKKASAEDTLSKNGFLVPAEGEDLAGLKIFTELAQEAEF